MLSCRVAEMLRFLRIVILIVIENGTWMEAPLAPIRNYELAVAKAQRQREKSRRVKAEG